MSEKNKRSSYFTNLIYNRKENRINKRGITLVALVITIVVLSIIAAVAINLTIGDNGTFNRAKTGQEKYKFESEFERLQLAVVDEKIDLHASNKLKNLEKLGEDLNEKNVIRDGWFIGNNEEIAYESTATTSEVLVGNVSENMPRGTYLQVESYQYGYTFYIDGNYDVKYGNDTETGSEEEGTLFSEPGKYKLTINAGSIARWICLVKQKEYIPEGASITYTYQTSNDRVNWSGEVSEIADLPKSQYARVLVNITSNSSGESPYVKGIYLKFLAYGSDENENDNIEEITKVGNTPKIKFTNPVVPNDTVIELPINVTKDGVTDTYTIKVGTSPDKTDISSISNAIPGLSVSDNGSINAPNSGGSISLSYSNDGTNWTDTPAENQTYSYIKVNTDIPQVNGTTISYGLPSTPAKEVKVQTASKELTWTTVDTQTFFAETASSGEWVGIEPNEYIPSDKTRIIYTFAKSNNLSTWTAENESISAGGNSKALRVTATMQVLAGEDVSENPRVDDIIINFKVNNQSKRVGMRTTVTPNVGSKVSYRNVKFNIVQMNGNVATLVPILFGAQLTLSGSNQGIDACCSRLQSELNATINYYASSANSITARNATEADVNNGWFDGLLGDYWHENGFWIGAPKKGTYNSSTYVSMGYAYYSTYSNALHVSSDWMLSYWNGDLRDCYSATKLVAPIVTMNISLMSATDDGEFMCNL